MIWLVGNKGMLGHDVEKDLKKNGFNYIASDIEINISDYLTLKNFVNKYSIKWIINCAAYTNIDKAEIEPDKTYKINSLGAFNLAKIAKEIHATLIHISTDYVFLGNKIFSYTEKDFTLPQTLYGKTKLIGERNVQILEKHFIIRTSWLYGKNGNNFVLTMLKLFQNKKNINVVSDQYGSPTYTKDLANFIIKIIHSGCKKYGIYNYANKGKTSWFKFAKEIYKQTKKMNIINNDTKIIPIKSDEYIFNTKRPKNSYLSKKKTKKIFKIKIPLWKKSLYNFLQEIKNNEKIT